MQRFDLPDHDFKPVIAGCWARSCLSKTESKMDKMLAYLSELLQCLVSLFKSCTVNDKKSFLQHDDWFIKLFDGSMYAISSDEERFSETNLSWGVLLLQLLQYTAACMQFPTWFWQSFLYHFKLFGILNYSLFILYRQTSGKIMLL